MRSYMNLLGVVYDGMKDSNMLYDYAEDAREEKNEKLADWFTAKADERVQRTEQEWSDAKGVLEDAGCCDTMMEHIEHDMLKLKDRKAKR